MPTERTALPRTYASLRVFPRAFGRAAREGRVIERASVVGSVAPAIPFRSIFKSVAAQVGVAEDLEKFDRVLADGYGFPPGVLAHCFPRLLEAFHGYVLGAGGTAVCALATVEIDGDCDVTPVGTASDARRPRRGLTADVLRARAGPGSRMPEHHAPGHLDGGLALRPARLPAVWAHQPVGAAHGSGFARAVMSGPSSESS